MRISRRPALDSERDSYRLIHHAAYREAVERQFGPWDEEAQDRFWEAGWHVGTHEALLCDGELAGYCRVETREADVHVVELVVDPRFQNLGIGTSVLRDAQHAAGERGVPVVLGTFIENRAAELYERLGFVEFDRTATHRLFRWHPA